jgi:non-canonical (house-cleaning) NTP pyrophosphatase
MSHSSSRATALVGQVQLPPKSQPQQPVTAEQTVEAAQKWAVLKLSQLAQVIRRNHAGNVTLLVPYRGLNVRRNLVGQVQLPPKSQPQQPVTAEQTVEAAQKWAEKAIEVFARYGSSLGSADQIQCAHI